MIAFPCPEKLTIIRYDIRLVAGPRGLVLPPYKGLTLRGGFTGTFQRLVCSAGTRQCKPCPLKQECSYALIFESQPPPEAEALRNYESIPRPFILELPLEEKTEYAPGEPLVFRLVLFGRAANLLPYFIITLGEFSRQGIGRGRRPFTVARIAAVNPFTGETAVIYHQADRVVRPRDLGVTAKEIWARATGEMAGDGTGPPGGLSPGSSTGVLNPVFPNQDQVPYTQPAHL